MLRCTQRVPCCKYRGRVLPAVCVSSLPERVTRSPIAAEEAKRGTKKACSKSEAWQWQDLYRSEQHLLGWTVDSQSQPGHNRPSHSCSSPVVGDSAKLRDLQQPGQLQEAHVIETVDKHTKIESCSVQHPGSLCCSTVSVKRDRKQRSCTLAVEATVRLTHPDDNITMEEMEELGVLGIQRVAEDMMFHRNQTATLPAERVARHGEVVKLLQTGKITACERRNNRFGHVSYLVTLTGKNNKSCCAMVKPRVAGDCEGWHRTPIEVVAYRLNLLLGLDLVPPAVFRTECDVDWSHYEDGATFIYWCPNSVELSEYTPDKWNADSQALLADTRILDVLIQNSDRHIGHYLFGEHWAEGVNSNQGWRGAMRPVLIDHAAGFRPGAFVCLEHDNAFCTGPTKHISSRTYLRLRFLDQKTLEQAVGEFLSVQEIKELLERRDHMLAFYDSLVQQYGYDAVVFEPKVHSRR